LKPNKNIPNTKIIKKSLSTSKFTNKSNTEKNLNFIKERPKTRIENYTKTKRNLSKPKFSKSINSSLNLIRKRSNSVENTKLKTQCISKQNLCNSKENKRRTREERKKERTLKNSSENQII